MRYFTSNSKRYIRVHVSPKVNLSDPEFDRARAERFDPVHERWIADPHAIIDLLHTDDWEPCDRSPKALSGGRH